LSNWLEPFSKKVLSQRGDHHFVLLPFEFFLCRIGFGIEFAGDNFLQNGFEIAHWMAHPHDAELLVDDERRWYASLPVRFHVAIGNPALRIDRNDVIHHVALVLDERLDLVDTLAADADKCDFLVFEVLLQFRQVRYANSTRRAPRSPELHNVNCAFLEFNRSALYPQKAFQLGRGIAYLRPPFGILSRLFTGCCS
jgi:hypothetical protein